MPANNDMEILMQQKMEEFRLEPSPADWQAIYDRLHPRKNRRFFWWWFPLVAGLLFGGYWFTRQNDFSSTVTKTIADHPAAKSSAGSNTSVLQYKKESAKEPSNATSETPQPMNQESSESTNSTIPSQTETVQASPVIAKKSNQPIEIIHSNPTTDEISRATGTTAATPVPSEKISPDKRTAALEENEIVTAPSIQPGENEREKISESLKEKTITEQKSHTDSMSTIAPATELAVKKNSIPVLSNHADKGWYLGVYAELGTNKPTEPISMAKAADLNSFPGSGSLTSSESVSKGGLHYAFGLALERKLKKTSFSFGLGMQANTWSSASTTYKDSITGGNFLSRTSISNNNTRYNHVALELPVMFNFRISGKNHSSFWFTTGLNNTITLKLGQKTDVSLLQTNASYSLDNSLTSKASAYQPQIKIGIMYENTQNKYHWQLAPFMQYGLNNMVKSGSPDIHMLHFGIQSRYYFKRLR